MNFFLRDFHRRFLKKSPTGTGREIPKNRLGSFDMASASEQRRKKKDKKREKKKHPYKRGGKFRTTKIGK